MIAGSGAGSGPERDDAAAAVLNGFKGVALDVEAQAAIAATLAACAERARAADAAYESGGEDAADWAADDPGESFVRSEAPYRGELLPPCTVEDFEPFTPDEVHWHLAGAEKPAELVRWEEAQGVENASEQP